MKLKKYVGILSLASLLSVTTVLNVDAIDSNATSNTEGNMQSMETYCPCENMKRGPRGKMIFEESITELKKSGVLTDEDVKKIDDYNNKLMEKRKEEMKKKRHEMIDNMVNDKVISKEKGDRLKQSIDNNIEEHMKNHKLNK